LGRFGGWVGLTLAAAATIDDFDRE